MDFAKASGTLEKLACGKWRFLLMAFGAILSGITIVFPHVWFLQWISLVPVCLVVISRCKNKNISKRALYLDGLFCFFLYYLVGLHWFVYLYPLDFIAGMSRAAALTVIGVSWVGLSLLQALISAFAFVFASIGVRSRICSRMPMLCAIAVAAIWTIFEWFQTIGWWGVPWSRFSLGQIGNLIGLQTASLFGSYFITFILLSVNAFIAYALLNHNCIRLCCVTVLCLLVIQYGGGAIVWATTPTENGKPIKIACIQGNISSSEKWDSNNPKSPTEIYSRLTADAVEAGAEVVVWPETAITYNITNGEKYLSEEFKQLAKTNDIYLFVGCFATDAQEKEVNALLCFTPDGEMSSEFYAKRHLVPFGEYVPMKKIVTAIVPPLSQLVLNGDDLYEGKGAQLIEIGDEIKVGGLICFDSIYEELTLESLRAGANVFLLPTNDSWFKDSAAVYMHTAQAQLRAIESGRYVARAANTGISAVINPRGEICVSLEPLVEGQIVHTTYASERNTLWSILGNGFVYLLILLYVAVIIDGLYLKVKKLLSRFNNQLNK